MDTNSTAKAQPAADTDLNKPANIAPATDFSPSGAPRQTTDIPIDHPAIDNDPRAGTTVLQNKIDMNDPSVPGHVAVARELGFKEEPDVETKTDKK